MASMQAIRNMRTATMCAAMVFGLGVSAFAQQTYEGDIVAIDGTANTFTAKASKSGEVAEMAFHVGSGSRVTIDGEQRLFAELEKGDRVQVTYGTEGATHTLQQANRIKAGMREQTFEGNVIAVNLKAQTFTVKSMKDGKVKEMAFRVDPASRLYLGGDEAAVLSQLKVGEGVSVAYESPKATTHYAKQVKKTA